MLSPSYHGGLIRCRICWMVGLSAFASVVAIAAAILVPSYFSQRRDVLGALEMAGLSSVRALIDIADIAEPSLRRAPNPEEMLRVGALIYKDTPLRGAAIFLPDWTVLGVFGERPDPEIMAPPEGPLEGRRILTPDGARYDVLWLPNETGIPYPVIGRIDTTRLGLALMDYVLNAVGVVLLISVFVTLCTMTILGVKVLAPLLALRDSLLGASDDLRDPVRYRLASRNDELGQVGSAFNRLIERVGSTLTALNESRAALLRANEQLANFDPLTGLPNRSLLMTRLRRTWGPLEAQRQLLTVAMLGVDGFRTINEARGHRVGDEVLAGLAGRFAEVLGDGVTVARYDGDTFVLVQEDLASPEAAEGQLRQVLSAIREPFTVESREVQVSCSAGVAVYPQDATDPDDLLRCAEVAMHHAKAQRRGLYRFFDASLDARVRLRWDMEEALRTAIGKSQFVVHFQPKVALGSGMVVGAEALVRWVHPERGLVRPDEFIGEAERTGLINPLGGWVLETVCRQLEEWRSAGLLSMPIAVNLSPIQLKDPDLPHAVSAALARAKLEPSLLELEITETVIMDNVAVTLGTLGALRDLGVALSIDDFGTGHSSLSYLRRLPVSKLKIDQSLVRGIEHGGSAATIADAIIALGRKLDLTLVAEGVESEDQAAFLRRCGCDEAQGFLYGRPMDAEAFAKHLTGY